MLISLSNVSFEYLAGTPLARTALRGIDVSISAGEYVALVGPTGSGKSTLIQHLNGLLAPTSGTVKFEGASIETAAQREALRRAVGVVFQFPESQLFETTVADDIAFGPRQIGMSHSEVAERVASALEQVGLAYGRYAARSPFSLSGGEQRLVAIAGVLAMRPAFLVLDEPTSGLDVRGRSAVFTCLDRLNAEGVAVLMVTHSMDEIAESARRVVVLSEGRVVLDDTPAATFTHAGMLREIGLDVPAAVQLVLKLREKGLDVAACGVSMQEALDAVAAAVKEGGNQ